MNKPKISIEELEALLASDEDLEIELQPNGEIRAVAKGTAQNAEPKIITAKYAQAEYY